MESDIQVEGEGDFQLYRTAVTVVVTAVIRMGDTIEVALWEHYCGITRVLDAQSLECHSCLAKKIAWYTWATICSSDCTISFLKIILSGGI